MVFDPNVGSGQISQLMDQVGQANSNMETSLGNVDMSATEQYAQFTVAMNKLNLTNNMFAATTAFQRDSCNKWIQNMAYKS